MQDKFCICWADQVFLRHIEVKQSRLRVLHGICQINVLIDSTVQLLLLRKVMV
jgi:hypothetical protein